MEYHLKKLLGNVLLTTWGLEPAPPVISQQLCYPIDHHASPEKEASISEISNSRLSHSSMFTLTIKISVCHDVRKNTDEWERRQLLISGLDASFSGEA